MPAIDLKSLVARPGYAPTTQQSVVENGRVPVEDSPDLARIVALARRPRPDADMLSALSLEMTARLARDRGACDCKSKHNRACIRTLNTTQSWGLFELGTQGGLLGAIGVGHGKTIMGILAPLVVKGCQLAVLLCPPGLVEQLITEYQLLANHFRVPSLIVHGANRWEDVSAGRPLLHVVPYSVLSTAKATVLLENLRPDLIIADEAHKLKHKGTATTARVIRYAVQQKTVRFAFWSGSITDSSIKDYAHLLALALQEHSPLPVDPEVVNDWARAIDATPNPAGAGALIKLCEPGEHYRSGFRRRLTETEGVVSTVEASVAVGLVIKARKPPEIPSVIRSHLNDLRKTWTRPDGEELITALDVARCALELASGFYYRWVFPRGETVAQIETWLEARKNWNKELRHKVAGRIEHLDSPSLCSNAAARAHGNIANPKDLPKWLAKTWPAWYQVRDSVQPETEAVRVDPYLVNDCAEWADSQTGLVWYDKAAFGDWLSEVSGLPKCGGGAKNLEKLKKERGKRSVILSIDSHGTGRDGLQFYFSRQLIANPPSSATGWEQLLGRLHRQGQTSDRVSTEFYSHTPELKRAVNQALSRADYVCETQGSVQKVHAGLGAERENLSQALDDYDLPE
jgi:hypothetical protein